jgi:excisionase family DNA binding protein
MAARDDNVQVTGLMKARDAARRLTIGIKTFYRLVRAGVLPRPIRFGRRLLRWREEDLERWVKSQSGDEE